MDSTVVGRAAEAYVWMRLLERGMIPCIPMVDCQGFDAIVRMADGQCVRVQVKSRGTPLPTTGAYGEQIKSLWWDKTDESLAFDYLVISLPLEGAGGYEAWVIPVEVVRGKLSKGGDLTLSQKLLRGDWDIHRERWTLDNPTVI